jgi:glycopeptide antibiotics resistance protein
LGSAIIISAGVYFLSPFYLTANYGRINWVPFLPYYRRTTFTALSNALESLLIFFPAGFWGQYWFSRKKPRVLFLAIASLLTVISLESAQGRIIGRYPDTTDVLGALAGTLFGAWCCLGGWTAFERSLENIANLPVRVLDHEKNLTNTS